MTKTNNQIAGFCVALLLTLAIFQQAIVVPADHSLAFAPGALA